MGGYSAQNKQAADSPCEGLLYCGGNPHPRQTERCAERMEGIQGQPHNSLLQRKRRGWATLPWVYNPLAMPAQPGYDVLKTAGEAPKNKGGNSHDKPRLYQIYRAFIYDHLQEQEGCRPALHQRTQPWKKQNCGACRWTLRCLPK